MGESQSCEHTLLSLETSLGLRRWCVIWHLTRSLTWVGREGMMGLERRKNRGGTHIHGIMGDDCCASARVIHQLHGGCIWLKALRAGTDELKGQPSRQPQPGVCDVVAVAHIDNLCAAKLFQTPAWHTEQAEGDGVECNRIMV